MLTRISAIGTVFLLVMLLTSTCEAQPSQVQLGCGTAQAEGNKFTIFPTHGHKVVFIAEDDGAIRAMAEVDTETETTATVRVNGELHDAGYLYYNPKTDEWLMYSIQHDETYPLDDIVDKIDLGFGRLKMDYPVIMIKTYGRDPSLITAAYNRGINRWFIGEVPF